MVAAPLFIIAGATLEGVLKEETHRQFASAVGWKLLVQLLVSPLAVSGNRRLRRSRNNRRRRHRGSNALSGDGRNHTEGKVTRHRLRGKQIFSDLDMRLGDGYTLPAGRRPRLSHARTLSFRPLLYKDSKRLTGTNRESLQEEGCLGVYLRRTLFAMIHKPRDNPILVLVGLVLLL
jgi:hypothetical protein